MVSILTAKSSIASSRSVFSLNDFLGEAGKASLQLFFSRTCGTSPEGAATPRNQTGKGLFIYIFSLLRHFPRANKASCHFLGLPQILSIDKKASMITQQISRPQAIE